mmetsp:Transcript_12360/g.19487  ORF Transcript_12360/g.19487 Transcript_12360/m.19487 type:complete len:168 (-) Transcript_12360:1911-2414(-)
MGAKTLVAVLAVALVASASAFSVTPGALPLRSSPVLCSSRASTFMGSRPMPLRAHSAALAPRNGASSLQMGIFGLGWAELAVIGGIAALIFGPKNLAGLGKDLGKVAGSLKKEAATFSEAMNESLGEAEKAFEEGAADANKPKSIASEAPAAKPAAKPAKKVDLSDE